MVFCGKPSRGCATCRAKKKKCDEAFPACSLCERTGSKCPGYRDQLSLSFRDESQNVLRKIHRPTRKKTHSVSEAVQQRKASPLLEFTHDRNELGIMFIQSLDALRSSSASILQNDDGGSSFSVLPPDDSSHFECFSPMLEMSPVKESARSVLEYMYSGTISTYLSPYLRDQATQFFLQNYVFTEMATPHGGYLACLPTICGQVKEMKALSSIIISVGVAGISNIRKDPDLMRASQKIYSSTLQYTKSLLEDSSRAQEDQTLLVVLLLALYENITCCAPQSMQSWSRHVRGATALLSLRSHDSLSDVTLQELFIHLRQQIITDSLQRKTPVPQVIIDWSRKAKLILSKEKLWGNSMEEISIRLCQLRSSIKQGNVDDEEAIRQAMSIDKDLEDWLSAVPSEYKYTRIYDFENPGDVFFGCYHVYPETKVAIAWNHYRSLRIITNEVIVDALYSSGSISSYEEQRLASEQLFTELTAEICGSVPPFLGYPNGQNKPPVMIGMLLLWPLYTCAAQDYASPKVRDWVIRQFDKIGETMGIQLATSLARVLRTRREITVWDRIDTGDGQNLVQGAEWDEWEEW